MKSADDNRDSEIDPLGNRGWSELWRAGSRRIQSVNPSNF